jgi:uncharacterized protein YgiM (DUF1202 family)
MKKSPWIFFFSLFSVMTGLSQSSWPSVNFKTNEFQTKCYGDGPTYYTTRLLEMYESMSMESAVMLDVPKGAAVLVTNSFFGAQGWWEVCYQGKTGWVDKDHLTRKRVSSKTPVKVESEDNEAEDNEAEELPLASGEEGNDVGFNPFLAQVSKVANFRSAPSTKSIILRQLPVRTQLYIFSDQTANEFYKVIDIATGKVGWVSKSLIRRTGDADVNYSGAFQSTGSTSDYNSEVTIRNKSSRKITLIVGGQTYTLAPHSTETQSLSPGKMYYIASAAGVIPTSGYQTFSSFQGYEWEFWIETR